MNPSRVAVLWHFFKFPFRIVPKLQYKVAPDIDGGLLSVSWLGSQTCLFWGEVSEFAVHKAAGL